MSPPLPPAAPRATEVPHTITCSHSHSCSFLEVPVGPDVNIVVRDDVASQVDCCVMMLTSVEEEQMIDFRNR